MTKLTSKLKITLVTGLIFIVLWFIAIYPLIGHALSETLVLTPTKTERVDGRYLVYTDKGVFQDTDDYRFFKWNSSDVYAKLNQHLNRPVEVKVTGLRVPFFSWYKNIIEINPR